MENSESTQKYAAINRDQFAIQVIIFQCLSCTLLELCLLQQFASAFVM